MSNVQHLSRRADTVALAVSLAVVGAVFAVARPMASLPGQPTDVTATAAPVSVAPAALSTDEVGSVRVTLEVGDQLATATLDDTPAAHQLAAMLPVTVDLDDPFGQAKSGALPYAIDVAGAARQLHPVTGGIYYWPDGGGQLAAFHDAFGPAVPAPGLVRLGSVDTGLDAIATRGDVTVTIDRAG